MTGHKLARGALLGHHDSNLQIVISLMQHINGVRMVIMIDVTMILTIQDLNHDEICALT